MIKPLQRASYSLNEKRFLYVYLWTYSFLSKNSFSSVLVIARMECLFLGSKKQLKRVSSVFKIYISLVIKSKSF